MGDDRYWLRRGTEVYGPFAIADLTSFEANRRVGPHDELRRDGDEQWSAWTEFRAAHSLAPPPPISPPTQRGDVGVLEDPNQPRNRGLEFVVPINCSPLSIIAPYIGLFSFATGGLLGPVAIGMGIWAWRITKPNQAGRGRAVMAIVLGSLSTILLIWLATSLLG